MKTPYKAEGERLRELIEVDLGLTISAFGASLGKSPQNMNLYISGQRSLGNKLIGKIVQAYPNVNPEYLLRGTPPKLKSKISDGYDERKELEELKKEKAKLIDIIHDLVKQIDKN